MIGDSKSNSNHAFGAERTRRNYAEIARDLAWGSSEADRAIKLEVISGSMLPMLKPGDKVLVDRAQADSLRIGDLVVTRKRGEFITHRLVGRGAETWITKGDGLRHLDPPVAKDAILGKVVSIERKGVKIDLQTSFWNWMNFSLGYIYLWEGLLFRLLRAVKSRLKSEG